MSIPKFLIHPLATFNKYCQTGKHLYLWPAKAIQNGDHRKQAFEHTIFVDEHPSKDSKW